MSDISINLDEYLKLVSEKDVYITLLIVFACLFVLLLVVIGIIASKNYD